MYQKLVSFFSLLSILFCVSCTTRQEPPVLEKTLPKPVLFTSTNTLDAIICSVGDEIILLSDLQNAITHRSEGKGHLLSDGSLRGISKDEVQSILDTLVFDKIVEFKVQENKLSLTDIELNERINAFLQQQNYTIEQLETSLQNSGRTMEDYKKDFRKQVEQELLIGKIISPFIAATHEEIESFYYEKTGAPKMIRTVNLRSLRIDDEPETSEKTVQTVKKLLEEKQDFTNLVMTYSDTLDKEETKGILPPKPINELPDSIQPQIKTAEIGAIIGPIYIEPSTFFFQYIGSNYEKNSELEKDFEGWKNRFLSDKVHQRFKEYLSNERSKIQINFRSLSLLEENPS